MLLRSSNGRNSWPFESEQFTYDLDHTLRIRIATLRIQAATETAGLTALLLHGPVPALAAFFLPRAEVVACILVCISCIRAGLRRRRRRRRRHQRAPIVSSVIPARDGMTRIVRERGRRLVTRTAANGCLPRHGDAPGGVDTRRTCRTLQADTRRSCEKIASGERLTEVMVARRAPGAARGIQARLAHTRDAVSVPGCVCAVAEDADTHCALGCTPLPGKGAALGVIGTRIGIPVAWVAHAALAERLGYAANEEGSQGGHPARRHHSEGE